MLPFVFTQGTAMQVFAAFTIAFCFAAVNAAVRPYASASANALRLTADGSLIFTLLCVTILHLKEGLLSASLCETLTEERLGNVLITINFGLLVTMAAGETLRSRYQMYSDAMLVGISYMPDAPLATDRNQHGHRATAITSHAQVYRGEYKASASATPVLCAVKLRPRTVDNRIIAVESGIMLQCQHMNIVSIYHTEEVSSLYYSCTELCARTVEQAVVDGSVAPALRTQLCRAMIEGVQAFHTAGFIHGNLTPTNFLLSDDGGPRLCGFSCATWHGSSGVAIQLDTLHASTDCMPAEVVAERKHNLIVNILNPMAVDVFALGTTLCFVLANGTRPFETDPDLSREQHVTKDMHGVDQMQDLTPDAKHLVSTMLSIVADDRPRLADVLEHPFFWGLERRVKYLGETVGSILPVRLHATLARHSSSSDFVSLVSFCCVFQVRIHKKANPFIHDLEELADKELGPFNESQAAAGGSWARQLDMAYPLGGDWGGSQQPPADVEADYHIYGAQAKPKQKKEREGLIAANKPLGGHASKEIRMVGLLKFIRNVGDAHGAQMVKAGRFESLDALHNYLVEPFPWLLIGVYVTDAKHGLTQTTNPRLTPERRKLDVTVHVDAHVEAEDREVTLSPFSNWDDRH